MMRMDIWGFADEFYLKVINKFIENHNIQIIIMMFVLLPAVSAAVEQKAVTVAISLTPLSAPFIIADERGFFVEEGLDISMKEFRGGYRTIGAF